MLAFIMSLDNPRDRTKLEEIYYTYRKDMYITAYTVLKNTHDASDMVQEAIIRVSKNLHKISEIKCKKTRAYLVVIVRNLSINLYNNRKGLVLYGENLENTIPTETTFMDEMLLKTEFKQVMEKFLGEIHPPYADILMLRYYYELEISEISSVLDISENNVSVRINRGINSLRKLLKEEGLCYEKIIQS